MSADDSALDLDALVQAAQAEKPPVLRSIDARRMVRAAVEQGLKKRKVRTQSLAVACAAVIFLGFAAAGHVLFSERVTTVEVRRGDRPLRLALRSGDTLVAAPASELEILAQEAERRVVRVGHGAALFDVRPLRDGERFEVETAHAALRVLGTVFAVEVEDGRTIVRVYEGRVFVGNRVVRAGSVWVSAGEAPPAGGEPLAREASEALALRKPPTPSAPHAAPAVIVVPVAEAAPRKVEGGSPTVLPQAADLTIEGARKVLAQGDAEQALALAAAHAREGRPDWLLLSADALSALGRFGEAALRYEDAARVLTDAQREKAALSAAELTLLHTRDAGRTLTLLDGFALDDDRSSVRERASVLRVDALLALGQPEAARVHALRYLDREPETQTSARMRRLLD